MKKEVDLNLLKHASDYLNILSDGANPLTGEMVENEVINNPKISKCLKYVNSILNEIIYNGEIKVRKHFYISNEDISKYTYDKALPISHIVNKINELNTNKVSKKLNYKDLTAYLINENILSVQLDKNNKKSKVPTQKGKDIGLHIDTRKDSYGRIYDVVIYSNRAQKFIVDNMLEIIKFISKD